MTHSTTVRTGRALGVLAAACLLAAAALPARAADRETIPGNWLYLTLTTGDSRSSDTRGTLLMCDPPQGHTRAAEACEALTGVDGDIARLTPRDAVCAMLYAPVTARAEGRWNGEPVAYERQFGNPCELQALTGAVFALDG
ncbi:SSI family serine proteinase inhibitor [Streptomyces sp. NPDC048002]|uniref:SSI family serine proteinase inhibitor n=1 Tax=unclassified Streptomyces TaxID=2593676 RepID=UPI0033F4208A